MESELSILVTTAGNSSVMMSSVLQRVSVPTICMKLKFVLFLVCMVTYLSLLVTYLSLLFFV